VTTTERTVEDHTAGAGDEVVALYHRFIALAEQCGPFTYRVTKSAITLKGTRRGFAGAVLRKDTLGGYFDVTRQITDARILRSSPYTKRLFVHQFRILAPDQLDDVFAGWLAEAYAVGQGAHLLDP
jgi:hypothetical protein